MHQALKFMLIPIALLIASLFMLFYPPLAPALQADSTQKVYIMADSSIYNYKTGVNTFAGHVKVDQGTSHITADRLITKSNNQHKIQEATAYGIQELAHYWTLPNNKDPEIHAHARIIKFYPQESNVTLEQDVLVTQGENSFHGQLILYNRNDQTITVPASQSGRSVVVYNPTKN